MIYFNTIRGSSPVASNHYICRVLGTLQSRQNTGPQKTAVLRVRELRNA